MADDSEERSSCSQPKKPRTEPRKYTKLPVEVCENHDAVLYPIHRAIASRHLPFHGVTLVHFDSHPDLAVPAKMPADWVFDTERLAGEVSIADWILPAVYAGHINRVVWVKPEWADQMEGETKTFYIGKHKETGFLRVTCKDDYYLEELLYAPRDQLENIKELEFKIFTLNSTPAESRYFQEKKEILISKMSSLDGNVENRKKPDCDGKGTDSPPGNVLSRQEIVDKEIQSFNTYSAFDVNEVNEATEPQSSRQLTDLLLSMLSDNQPYILDVDMDFFSVKNPFKDLFTEEEFKCLADIYKFTPPLTNSQKDLEKCIMERSSQLDCIEKTFKYAETVDKSSNTSCDNDIDINKQLLKLLQDIKSCGERQRPEDELIHFAGMTIDIPHHISTKQEIDNLLYSFYCTVKSLPKPTMVTMARSTYDEYAPPHQVDYIQNSLINILGYLYGQDCIDIRLHY